MSSREVDSSVDWKPEDRRPPGLSSRDTEFAKRGDLGRRRPPASEKGVYSSGRHKFMIRLAVFPAGPRQERLPRVRHLRRSQCAIRSSLHFREQFPAYSVTARSAPLSVQLASMVGGGQGSLHQGHGISGAPGFMRLHATTGEQVWATKAEFLPAVADRKPITGLRGRVLGQSFRLSITGAFTCPRECPRSYGLRSSGMRFWMAMITSRTIAICRSQSALASIF